jgi:hypothetical protein
MPRRLRLVLLSLLAAVAIAAALPAAASARVVLVASGDTFATLTDVTTNRVTAGCRCPAARARRRSRPDGARGYVAADATLAALDLAAGQAVALLVLPGRPTALAISADGLRLYAARRGAVDVVDTTTFALVGSIALG